MLVLSRKKEEGITIRDTQTGEEIKVRVIEIKGNTVRLGTNASDRFRIIRTELAERDRLAAEQAAQGTKPDEGGTAITGAGEQGRSADLPPPRR